MTEGVVTEYVHNKAADGLGKIGVLVAVESKGEKAALTAFGRQLAMHIAAASPAAVSADQLDPALVERERAVYTEQAKASGKAPDIIAKMVEGRLRKEFYQQVVLLQQIFLGAGGDGKQTVEQVLKSAEKSAGRLDQDRQVRALCAGRGHRQEGWRFRCRGGCRSRQALTRGVNCAAEVAECCWRGVCFVGRGRHKLDAMH